MPKLDIAIDQSEECMITTYPNMRTWMDLGTALTYDNATSRHQLTIEALDTKHLWATITTIT
jgi:hypothetical protein